MTGKNLKIDSSIKNKIYTIRNTQVMLDRDLAELYGVETRVLNQAVKRNPGKFPNEFMFRLTLDEVEEWMSQIVISNKEKMGIRKMPYTFTEQGVVMLASVLKSDIALQISIKIVKSFIQMRKFLINNAEIFFRLDRIENKQLITDERLEKVFKVIESKEIKPEQGIFFNGEIFDAYTFVSKLIKSASKNIVLIDNYIDESVLLLFSKRNTRVKAEIYTRKIDKKLKLDITKHNSQYEPIDVKCFDESHDRFLIIDEKEVYHIGASLKDLGKKWFAFSKINLNPEILLDKLSKSV